MSRDPLPVFFHHSLLSFGPVPPSLRTPTCRVEEGSQVERRTYPYVKGDPWFVVEFLIFGSRGRHPKHPEDTQGHAVRTTSSTTGDNLKESALGTDHPPVRPYRDHGVAVGRRDRIQTRSVQTTRVAHPVPSTQSQLNSFVFEFGVLNTRVFRSQVG